MDYSTVLEFNTLRGKEFVPFSSYLKVMTEARQDGAMPDNRTPDLIKKLMAGTESRTSVVVISGIPGSGKGRASEYLYR
jgi:putative protein kinase ArgK-like GTPase of G3E family